MDSRSLLPIGTKLQMGRYRVDRYLSSGSFGNTYVITELQFGEQYAMKEFFMKGVNERGKDYTTICVSNKVNYERYEQQREKFKKEARRMRQLSNKHLVKVYDLFDENGTTYYVMDLIHGQTMQDAMEETGRTYTESQAINVVYQVLEALDTLHQKGIWHLDLKPANIMINDQGLVKVIDFGASKQMNANLEYTSTSAAICYTPGYAPTEQVDQNISRIGPWTDLYALGATLYYMLTGSQPPSSSEILDGYAFQFKFPVSNEIQQLIIWMMKPNRKERPQSVAEVRDYLNKIQRNAPAVEKNETKEEPVMQNFADNEGDSENKIKKIAIALVGVIIGLIILIAIGVNYRYNNQSTDLEDSEGYSFYSNKDDNIKDSDSIIINEDYYEVDSVVNNVSNSIVHEAPPDNPIELPGFNSGHEENTDPEPPKEETRVFDVVEEMPQFPGGNSALMEYLGKNIKYPVVAEENGIQGRVVCTFIIERDGSIVDVRVVNSVDPLLDKEAIRVVKSMPRWIPGKQDGSAVRVKYTLPVTFKLQ